MTQADSMTVRQVVLAGSVTNIAGNPADPYFQQVEVHASGFQVLAALAERNSSAGRRIFDVGANIGLSTIAMARACPGIEVVAFEPSPVTAKYLRYNLSSNNIPNVTLIEAALSDAEGELQFSEEVYAAGSHVVPQDHLDSSRGTVRVRMTTLDSMMGGGGPVAFLKIDAEGHEPNILAGGRRLIERDRPTIFMEFNSWCLNAFGGHSPAAFAKALWQTFKISKADLAGNLSELTTPAIQFLHVNLTRNGCVDDLILQLREGSQIPCLAAMSWPSSANQMIAELEQRIQEKEPAQK